jgi:hypothetical protein
MNNPNNAVSDYELSLDHAYQLIDRLLVSDDSMNYETMSDEVTNDLIAKVATIITNLGFTVRTRINKYDVWYIIYTSDMPMPMSNYYSNASGKNLLRITTSKINIKERRIIASLLCDFLEITVAVSPSNVLIHESMCPRSF